MYLCHCLQTRLVPGWWKKTLRSSQDSNLGPLNSSQMLLPMSYWSSGIGAEDRWHLSIDTVRFSGWISLKLGELYMISTEVLCAATSELGNSSSYSVCAVPSSAHKNTFQSFPVETFPSSSFDHLQYPKTNIAAGEGLGVRVFLNLMSLLLECYTDTYQYTCIVIHLWISYHNLK